MGVGLSETEKSLGEVLPLQTAFYLRRIHLNDPRPVIS